MKTKIQFLLIALLVTMVMSETVAQEDKKIKIYLDIEKNGEKIKIDTTFSSGEEMKLFMQSKGFDSPGEFEFKELKDIEDMKGFEYEFRFDDSELTPEKEAEIKKAMEKAKVEFRKAEAEMSISKKELRKAKTEMKNAKELHSKIILEIDDLESPDQKIMLKRTKNNFDDGESKVIIIDAEGSADDVKEMMFVKVYCDSITTDDAKVKIIRKARIADSDAVELQWDEKEISTPEIEIPAEKPTLAPKVDDDYRLNVTDFKLYPNPTQGKITVSFTVETPGIVHVRLLDAVGRVVADEEVSTQDGTFNKEYSIEGNSRGTYLLQLKQGEKWRHEKIVVK